MNEHDLTPGESAVLLLDEAENLIWALLDDHIDEAETARLTKLMNEHEEVRRRYVDCVQLHADLRDHFATVTTPEASRAKANILPNLMSGGLSGVQTPVTD
jgi:anti-sigma factor RsiW